MRNIKGLKGLIVFVACLWAVVVTTYATQSKGDAANKKKVSLISMTAASCSSSSSSSGGN